MKIALYMFIGIYVIGMSTVMAQEQSFKLGLENIPDSLLQRLHGYRIGLVANHTSKDQQGRRTVDIVRAKGLNIIALLAPEHGFFGKERAEMDVAHGKDCITGIPIMSLYSHGGEKKIPPSILDGIDIFIFDIQDVGMRHYTYLSTLYTLMRAAAEHHKYVIVLDRPNPLGSVMDGPLVDDALLSFISIAPIPVRHGLTMGELARYFNIHHFQSKVLLLVVPMQQYQRDMIIPPQLCMNLSPNVLNRHSCYGYSFLGLLGEVRPFDVGIGTQYSFQYFAIPAKYSLSQEQWQLLQNKLKELHVDSVMYTYFNKRKKAHYAGLKLHIVDINKVPTCTLILTIISFLKQAGVPLTFSPAFDKAIGTKKMQEWFNGSVTNNQIQQIVNEKLQHFYNKVHSFLLYFPAPKIINVTI